MKTITLATDFSTRSDRALRRATLLARQSGARLELVHVIDDDQSAAIVDSERGVAGGMLDRMVDTLKAVDGVQAGARIIAAPPFAGIARAVEETACDLLVIGAHRRQLLRDVFLGTTAERTIRSVSCPVLMVNATPTGNYDHVLQATDLSEGSRLALQRFQALGMTSTARNTVLHVFDAPALRLVMKESLLSDQQEQYLAVAREEAARSLAAFIASAGLDKPRARTRYGATGTAYEILKAAAEEAADLIVVSTCGRSALAKLFIGSVAERVLQLATVDVLAVPPAAE